jgi:hypothetical protein
MVRAVTVLHLAAPLPRVLREKHLCGRIERDLLGAERDVALRGGVRGAELPAVRQPLVSGHLDALVRVVGVRIVDQRRAGELTPRERLRELPVRQEGAGVVGGAGRAVRPGIPAGHRDVVRLVGTVDLEEPIGVEVPGIDRGDANPEVLHQLALEREGELFGLRLKLVRVGHGIGGAGDRQEVGSVRIEVDLSGLVQPVAVQIVPTPGRRRIELPVRRRHLWIDLAHVVETSVSALQQRLAVPGEVECRMEPRRDASPDLHLRPFLAEIRSGELGRIRHRIALLRNVPAVARNDAQPQIQREPPPDHPGVLHVQTQVIGIGERHVRMVPGQDLDGLSVVEAQLIVAALPRDPVPVDYRLHVVEPKLEVVVAPEQGRFVPGKASLRMDVALTGELVEAVQVSTSPCSFPRPAARGWRS